MLPNPDVGAYLVVYGGHPNVKPDLASLQTPVLGVHAGGDGFVSPPSLPRRRPMPGRRRSPFSGAS